MLRLISAVAVLSLLACGAPESTTTTTSQTCSEKHECINGSCRCTAGPKDGSSCCDPTSTTCSASEKCDSFCRYCQ